MNLLQLKVTVKTNGGSFDHWDKGDLLKQIITIESLKMLSPMYQQVLKVKKTGVPKTP